MPELISFYHLEEMFFLDISAVKDVFKIDVGTHEKRVQMPIYNLFGTNQPITELHSAVMPNEIKIRTPSLYHS